MHSRQVSEAISGACCMWYASAAPATCVCRDRHSQVQVHARRHITLNSGLRRATQPAAPRISLRQYDCVLSRDMRRPKRVGALQAMSCIVVQPVPGLSFLQLHMHGVGRITCVGSSRQILAHRSYHAVHACTTRLHPHLCRLDYFFPHRSGYGLSGATGVSMPSKMA